jgi:hypothetical protein
VQRGWSDCAQSQRSCRSALLPDISWAGWWSGTRNLGPLEQISTRVDYVNSLQENLEGQQAASEGVRSEFKALVEQCRGYGQKPNVGVKIAFAASCQKRK